jgi:hypothetical protein
MLLLQAMNGLPPSKGATLFKQETGFIQARRKILLESLMDSAFLSLVVKNQQFFPR